MTKAKTRTTLVIISVALSVIALVAAIFGIFTPSTPKDIDAVGRFDWVIGSISDTGKLVESSRSIYTKDMMDVNKIEIDISDDDAIITYKVVFYDEAKEFVSMTDALTSDYDVESLPESAEYFRVLVTPAEVDEEPVEVTVFNMSKYINQIEITYSK